MAHRSWKMMYFLLGMYNVVNSLSRVSLPKGIYHPYQTGLILQQTAIRDAQEGQFDWGVMGFCPWIFKKWDLKAFKTPRFTKTWSNDHGLNKTLKISFGRLFVDHLSSTSAGLIKLSLWIIPCVTTWYVVLHIQFGTLPVVSGVITTISRPVLFQPI